VAEITTNAASSANWKAQKRPQRRVDGDRHGNAGLLAVQKLSQPGIGDDLP